MVALPLGDVIDFAKERARLEKDLKKAQDEIARFDAKLSNEQFVSKAPEEVLTEQREKRAEAAGAGGAADRRHQRGLPNNPDGRAVAAGRSAYLTVRRLSQYRRVPCPPCSIP